MKSGSTSAAETVPFPRRLPATVAALAFASLGGCSVFEPPDARAGAAGPARAAARGVEGRLGADHRGPGRAHPRADRRQAADPGAGRVVQAPRRPSSRSCAPRAHHRAQRRGAQPSAAPGRLFDAQGLPGRPDGADAVPRQDRLRDRQADPELEDGVVKLLRSGGGVRGRRRRGARGQAPRADAAAEGGGWLFAK